MEESKKVVLLLSGGIDSTVTLFLIKKYQEKKSEVFTLVVDYGQVNSREIQCAMFQTKVVGAKGPTIVSLRGIGKMLSGVSLLTGGGEAPAYVPFRNLVLLSVAFSFAESIGAEKIYYGANFEDIQNFWDCRPEFVERVNRVAELSGKELKVVAPYLRFKKSEIIAEGLKAGVDFFKTWTCYLGGEKPCGSCPACKLREKGFYGAGVLDPLLVGGK